MATDKEGQTTSTGPKFELGDQVWAKNIKHLAGREGYIKSVYTTGWPKTYFVQFGTEMWEVPEEDLERGPMENGQPVMQLHPEEEQTREIPATLYDRLLRLGMIPNDVREANVGASNYSEHLIQPWAIWQEYGLDPWDADIVKRVLRRKATDTRRMDYEKIIHICRECIRQIDTGSRANEI
ncbi:MAG: hypothetical protein IJV24_03235 [Prevotella sp.]|nr:hypothetical protein [Prevotella sp.]